MKKYAKIRIKTAKTYAMAIKEAGSQEIDLEALESSSDPLEKLNFTQKNTLLLPILDNLYLRKNQQSNNRGLYTYDIFVEIYENDTQKDAMHFYGHESNNFCYDAFFPNDFLKSKNNDKASIVKLDEIGASETFYEFELEQKEEFDIKNLFISSMPLSVLDLDGTCALKGVYYVKNLADYIQKLHLNEILIDTVNFEDRLFCEISEHDLFKRAVKRNNFIKELEKIELKQIDIKTKASINQRYIIFMANGFLSEKYIKKDHNKGVDICIDCFGVRYFEFGSIKKDNIDIIGNISKGKYYNIFGCYEDKMLCVYPGNAKFLIEDKQIKDWERLIFRIPINDLLDDDRMLYTRRSKEEIANIAFNIPLDRDNFALDDLYIMVYSLPIKDAFNIIGGFYYIPKAIAKYIMYVCGKQGELRDHIGEIFKEIEENLGKKNYFGVKKYTNIDYLENLFGVFKISPTLGKLETNEYDIKIYDNNMNVIKNKTLVFY
ncbi:hypothetical protein [uncultured Campylobacter sp.]|uniref:hypothetical protein n=1 Tax=uncultured Campylobacter sp. TaxID=218934 RepID=UPI0028EAF1A9|nr:hypothetical protein [uncultured Campylobacter sp.]